MIRCRSAVYMTSRRKKLPDVGAATPKIVEFWERALSGKESDRNDIAQYAAKQPLTVREKLIFAWLRNKLSLLEPPLPVRTPANALNVWNYWIDHPDEMRTIVSLQDEITSYLGPPEQIASIATQSHVHMLDLIRDDDLTFMALAPVVGEMNKKKRGRPATRRFAAVGALQMQMDNKWNLKKVTPEVCDCGKARLRHDQYCEQQLRQSIVSLRKLLRKIGARPTKP